MDHVAAVSDDLRRHLGDLKVPASKCSLIENAIDTAQYLRRRTPAAARAALGLDPARMVVGAVGRLSPEKGFDTLIRAADRLLRGGADFDLLIVGEGPEKPRLQALIDELGRASRVRLLGHRSDMIDLFEAMDVFALSSLREGLPNVLLEAMALEVPVVATRVAGVPRLVADGESGLLVEPGDEARLAEALDRLLGDDGLRESLGRAARGVIERRFSFDVRMNKMRAVYDALLGPARGRGLSPLSLSGSPS
jgi:glycosyltransferase involved in cell wall biosynthesis